MRTPSWLPVYKNTFAKFFLTLCLVLAFMAMAPAQTLTTLLSFDGTNGDYPSASVVQGVDGNFYGTTAFGGTNNSGICDNDINDGCGTVFKLTPAGNLTTLYSFCSQSNCSDGAFAYAGLVLATDGNFYGTTSAGGTDNDGTVFKITPTGTLTTLYSFDGTHGSAPQTTLIQATDGNFYGTTSAGGNNGVVCNNGCGTIFRITPMGTLTALYSFCSQPSCADGAAPEGGLVEGNDGNLYGATGYGGANLKGTIFKATLGGALTTLHAFCSQQPCADGANPVAGLVQAVDGSFYGTTVWGGAGSAGTVFKITPGGALTTVYSFCVHSGCPDGANPQAPLAQATDGNFYGTTVMGGIYDDYGTIFKVTPAGALTTLHSFSGSQTDGGFPYDGLLQSTDGNLYGTTAGTQCYAGFCGTIFRLNVSLNPFVVTKPSFGSDTTPVTILGTNLSSATGVTFNGTSAPISSNTDSAITTTVPAGATTGTVQVTLPSGTLTSNADFQVTGPLQFIPIPPCRLVDTRQSGGPIQGGTSRSFIPSQLGGCNIPSSGLAAYSLNVTVVPNQNPLGYLTIWPQGEIQPFVSTMNSGDGRTKANAVIVPSGNNAVSVYVTDTTDVVLDIDGYFASPSGQTLQFYPLTPCRVADTRESDFPQGLGTPHLSQGVARDFPVLASSCIPQNVNAAAYSFNFTAIPYPSLGYPLAYLEVWPTGEQPQHPVSTLNNPTATYVANAAIVPAGSDGKITAYGSDDTDLAIDINGYFAAPGNGGLSLYPTVPCRVFDTRKVGNGQPFSGPLIPPVDVVDSPCGIPNTAQAYVFNATVVASPNLSYLTLWPDSEGQPVVSTLNAADGWITSNMAIVPNLNGSVDAYAAGITQLVLDISSYFAP